VWADGGEGGGVGTEGLDSRREGMNMRQIKAEEITGV
jgi:hypothetical protein